MMAFILSKNDIPFEFIIRQAQFGFERISSKPFFGNETSGKSNTPLLAAANQQHTCVLQVRDTSVRAHLDGKLLSEWKNADFASTSINPDWKLRNTRVPGIGAWGSNTIFKTIEVIEITGKGAFTRPNDPAAKEAEKIRSGASAAKPLNPMSNSNIGDWIELEYTQLVRNKETKMIQRHTRKSKTDKEAVLECVAKGVKTTQKVDLTKNENEPSGDNVKIVKQGSESILYNNGKSITTNYTNYEITNVEKSKATKIFMKMNVSPAVPLYGTVLTDQTDGQGNGTKIKLLDYGFGPRK